MGGRGATSTKGKAKQGGSLDKRLIDRANGTSILGNAGDRVNRTYTRNVEEINNLSLSKVEKQRAIKQQKDLAETTLKEMANNHSPYGAGAGPARFNKDKVVESADKVAKAESAIDTHMNNTRKLSQQNARKGKETNLTNALNNAIKNGDLEVTVNGETWRRKTRRGTTFTKVR